MKNTLKEIHTHHHTHTHTHTEAHTHKCDDRRGEGHVVTEAEDTDTEEVLEDEEDDE